jgi:thiol-disulfide isomerase/thioredoxin
MIRKILLTSLLLASMVSLAAAQQNYKTTHDDAGNKVLIGPINEKILANDSAFMWFFTGVNRYHPDTAWTKYISFYRDSFDVVAFIGTWCPDSKRLLPEFYRVMMASSYPLNRIRLYGLDHQLHGLGDAATEYDIDKTPTFVFVHDGQVIGKIQDKIYRSMEADIVSILQRQFAPDSSGLHEQP